MDLEPGRREQNMARWTFAGLLGVTAGPLALGAAVALGGGWRELYALFAGLTVVVVVILLMTPGVGRLQGDAGPGAESRPAGSGVAALRAGLGEAFKALRRREVR